MPENCCAAARALALPARSQLPWELEVARDAWVACAGMEAPHRLALLSQLLRVDAGRLIGGPGAGKRLAVDSDGLKGCPVGGRGAAGGLRGLAALMLASDTQHSACCRSGAHASNQPPILDNPSRCPQLYLARLPGSAAVLFEAAFVAGAAAGARPDSEQWHREVIRVWVSGGGAS